MVADENGGVEREELRRESGRGRKARGREVEMGRPAGSLEMDALKVLLKRKDMAVVMTVFSEFAVAKVEFASLYVERKVGMSGRKQENTTGE